MVQGYCNLLADLSLVIKMGWNVKKCTLYLYNIPYDVPVPEFHSVAWSYNAQGPAQGIIKTVVMRRDREGNLICYDVPKMIQNQVSEEILNILAPYKYLGITYNAQLDPNIGKEKMIQKMAQRIALIAHHTHSIQETTILHNMLVCQVATFSPICAYFSLADCEKITKQILTSYQFRMKYLSSDAKHGIFISKKQGGIGVCSFTKAYVGALLRDLEVYISHEGSNTSHAILASIQAATRKRMWMLKEAGKIPNEFSTAHRTDRIHISAKKTLQYFDNGETLTNTIVSHDHTHIMDRALQTTSALGFMLRNMNHELCSRFTDELVSTD
jgi:hypothetical protein